MCNCEAQDSMQQKQTPDDLAIDPNSPKKEIQGHDIWWPFFQNKEKARQQICALWQANKYKGCRCCKLQL